MRVATVADVHVANHRRHGGEVVAGINRRGQLTGAVFSRAVSRARMDGANLFVCAGDLFDSLHVPPQIVAMAQAALSKEGANEDYGPGDHWGQLVLGNHEHGSETQGDHALGPMAPVADVVDRPKVLSQDGAAVVLVPYAPGKAEDVIRAALAYTDVGAGWPEGALLVLHMGIKDARTPPWLAGAEGAIDVNTLAEIANEWGFSSVLAGDWHEHRSWRFDNGLEIMQVGALCPTGWDNPSTVRQLDPGRDPYGSLITWDSASAPGERLRREVIHGPRFVKTANVRDAITAASDTHRGSGNQVYVQIVASPDAVAAVNAAFAESDAHPAGYEVVVDSEDVRRRIESAAMSARDAETVERAVAEYVGMAPFEGDPDRDEVLRLVRHYVTAEGVV